MIRFFLLLLIFQNLFSEEVDTLPSRNIKNLVSSVFKIVLKEFPDAWNPSIIEVKEGFILTFRYLPEPIKRAYISYVGAVLLDKNFKQISPAQLLDLRKDNFLIPSQAEDARIFSYDDRLFIIYNDNPIVMNTRAIDRRDLYIAELFYSHIGALQEDGSILHFDVATPIKLIHPKMYSSRIWEKNWAPFVSNGTLYLTYSINPHEILCADLETGICQPHYSTPFSNSWKWGSLRGGTPATLSDGEFLAFFHSGKPFVSGASIENESLWHYLMGAYTFSATPPFNVTRISPLPINEKSFYIQSENPKRVVYPGGYLISGDNIYVAYGKDDCEIWVAVINKTKLLKTLRPV